jgi:hypothetical protein
MPPPREAIATMSTGDVTFADNQVAFCKSFDVIADLINNADKLMPNDHRHPNHLLRPSIPVVDVQVRAADGRFQNADQHIVTAELWNGNLFEP